MEVCWWGQLSGQIKTKNPFTCKHWTDISCETHASLCMGSIWIPRSRRYGAVVYKVTRFLRQWHIWRNHQWILKLLTSLIIFDNGQYFRQAAHFEHHMPPREYSQPCRHASSAYPAKQWLGYMSVLGTCDIQVMYGIVKLKGPPWADIAKEWYFAAALCNSGPPFWRGIHTLLTCSMVMMSQIRCCTSEFSTKQ